GEDLGIVPREVQRSIVRRGLQKMYVGYYEMAEGTSQFLRNPGKNTVASLATHDMPPFAAFWQGTDIEDKLRAGIITKEAARQDKHRRKILKIGLTEFLLKGKFIKEDNGDREILPGYLRFLAQSNSRLTLINLEDLWQETHLHNLPSTTREHPNWRFKSRYSFETFCKMPEVLSILKEINRDRRGL
ncbi:MAG TPA: 4-alpha-glucanotransferase, partial [Dehalococcoidales bacterium]|nr:4-alpha-glucanotransferase [Dehalococcoidales bacterium]